MDIRTIKRAHFAAAKIVEKLGVNYLIFFERMHREIKKAEKKQDLSLLALDIAKTSRADLIRTENQR